MITTAQELQWPSDIAIVNLQLTGLRAPSFIRMNAFTLDNRLIRGIIGALSPQDSAKVEHQLAGISQPSCSPGS